jgi:hypothetical protein
MLYQKQEGGMKRLVAACFALLIVAGCSSGQSELPNYQGNPQNAGSVARVERVGWYPAIVMRVLFWYAALPEPVSVSDGIQLYRISYWSHSGGKPELLSGLMAMPNAADLRGTVLYMHGTNTSRRDSISVPSTEGILISGAFAGGGYLLAAPDLAGLGISHAPQPYFINASTTEQTLDFLRAVQTVSHDLGHAWNANLYVSGFSQGGTNTALMQRELERLNDPAWQVRAAAGIAGPYNFVDIALPLAMTGAAPSDSDYLTNLALAYSIYYHQPLESVMKPDMAARARRLFDGDHSFEDVLKGMPRNPRELFTAEFLDAFDHKKPNWFLDDLRANECIAWAPRAPFRAYYGDKDLDAAPANSTFFAQEAARRGGHIQAIDLGPLDHEASAYHAVPRIRLWFDALSAASSAAH